MDLLLGPKGRPKYVMGKVSTSQPNIYGVAWILLTSPTIYNLDFAILILSLDAIPYHKSISWGTLAFFTNESMKNMV